MHSSHYLLQKVSKITSGTVVLALSGFLMLQGCVMHDSKYGKLKTSREVERLFENENFPPEYQYYHTGTRAEPLALIGLKSPYTMDNKHWTKTDPSQLRQLMENMRTYVMYSPISGSKMLGLDGQEIGIFYSKWKGGPIVMKSGDNVYIHLDDNEDIDRKGNS